MKNELAVTVNCTISVDDSTAWTSLKLVEIYLNHHNGIELKCDKRPDGTDNLYFAERGNSI